MAQLKRLPLFVYGTLVPGHGFQNFANVLEQACDLAPPRRSAGESAAAAEPTRAGARVPASGGAAPVARALFAPGGGVDRGALSREHNSAGQPRCRRCGARRHAEE